MTIKRKSQTEFIITSSEKTKVLLTPEKVEITKNNEGSEKSEPFVITMPGEYEVGGVSVFVFEPYPSIVVDVDSFSVTYVPDKEFDLNDQASTPSLYEATDILILPGSKHQLVKDLAPTFIISIDDIKELAGKIDLEIPEETNNLSVKSAADFPEETELVNLTT